MWFVLSEGSDDNSEPENVSTKPEDLSCKVPSHGVALVSGLKKEAGSPEPSEQTSPLLHPLLQHGHFLSKGAPLEPLSLNTPAELPWHRPQGFYPQHYLPVYPEVYRPTATYAPPSSPPSRFPPLPQPRPLYVHYPQAECPPYGLYSPAAPTPEDLSSPGSVASSGGSSPPRGKRCKDSSPRYQCNFCNKSYSTYSGLSKHQQFHCAANEDSAAKKTFSCKHCEKVYVSLGALKMHIRTHTLPCKCMQCGKAFSRPWLLQGHIRTHTGEKPFTCPHCNRAFADRSNLRAHLQTHSDVKKYSCPTCSKTFSRMSLLSKHCDGGCPGSSSSGEEPMNYPVSPSSSL